MKPAKLFNRNFTTMIIGQIISLFGNAILRFALPLYVLDATGNAAIFGGILALSMIPTVLLSPIGGVIADRFPSQRIMYVLDFATAALAAASLSSWSSGRGAAWQPVVMMMLLSVIQACYQPRSCPPFPPPLLRREPDGRQRRGHAGAGGVPPAGAHPGPAFSTPG